VKVWLKRISLSLLVLVVVIAVAASLLVGTRSGVQWLLEAANGFIPGDLQVGEARGTLLGDLHLQNVSYETPDMTVQVGEVVFSWTPAELLSGVFHLRELGLNKLRYEKLRESEEESSPEPLKLPDIDLPLKLKLDLVQVKAVEMILQPQAELLAIDEAILIADWTKSGINLSTLSVRTPMLDFHGKGNVDPKNNYPVDLILDWGLHTADLPKLSGKGHLKGDLDALNIRYSINGDVTAKIVATVHNLLKELDWEAQIAVSRLPAEYLPLEEHTRVGLNVDARGDLARADSRIRFTLSDNKGMQTGAKQSLLLNLVAGVQFSDQKFDLKGDWSKLHWPLTGTAQVRLPTGKLTASGIPDDYVFNLQSLVAGKDIPDGDWKIEGKGGLEQLHLEKLQGLILDGRIKAKGDLSWAPILTWDMDIQAMNINPGELAAEWPGKLSADIISHGKIPDTGLELQADIRELAGTLRDQPVAGRGSIKMLGKDLQLKEIQFSSGTATVSADGELGETWNLDWNLNIKDLADLLPQGKGAVQGRGSLKGSQDKPVAEGRINASAIVMQELQCEQCDLDFNLGLDDAHVSHLTLAGKNLMASAQQIHELSVKLDGSMQQHTLVMTADHAQAKLAFSATGTYRQDKTAWQGKVQQLDLDGGEIGVWKQHQPAELYASADTLTLSPLCLQDKETQLCAEVNRNNQSGDARLQIKNLSLERVHPWLPPEISELEGVLQLDARADLGETIEAKVNLVLEPGKITFLDPLSRPVSMSLHDGKVEMTYDSSNLSARWGLGLGENILQGELLIPRKALDEDPMTAPLRGAIRIVVPELTLVSAFVPDIRKIDGNIDVSLKLAGRLGDPRIKGHARVKTSEILIPRAGLELRDLDVQIRGDGRQELVIAGGVRSGEGALNLSGNVSLDANQGWPAKISFRGRRFQLANLPEAQVVITPDLTLETSKELIRVRGRLGVPVALIELNDLPEGSRSQSSDVVVVSEDGTVEDAGNSRVDAEVTIILGEQVHFTGFGLNADIGGRLTVDQNAGKYPTANGELKIEGGSFRAYGQNLKIEQGRISYAGGRVDNPGLRLKASRKIEDITVGVELLGTAKKPQFSTFSSDPDLLEKDVVSMLLTGQKTGDLENAKVYAGKQITPDLSVGVNVGGGSDGSEFVARYRLMDNVSLEGTSSAKKSGGSINYTLELE
jgi:translocation and assembly module TamB